MQYNGRELIQRSKVNYVKLLIGFMLSALFLSLTFATQTTMQLLVYVNLVGLAVLLGVISIILFFTSIMFGILAGKTIIFSIYDYKVKT